MAKKLPLPIIEIHGYFPLKIFRFNFKMLIKVYDHIKRMQMDRLMKSEIFTSSERIYKALKMTPTFLCLDN